MEKPLPKGAKLSVGLFLLGVLFIVLMLLFKQEIGHTLGSRDIIVITMLFISMLMYWFCDVKLTKIKESTIFHGGYESLVVILGICWFASTVIDIYVPTIKEQATVLLGQYPGLLALAFFCVSALLFSQGATSALLVPVAASLGCDAPMILACFVAVSGTKTRSSSSCLRGSSSRLDRCGGLRCNCSVLRGNSGLRGGCSGRLEYCRIGGLGCFWRTC